MSTLMQQDTPTIFEDDDMNVWQSVLQEVEACSKWNSQNFCKTLSYILTMARCIVCLSTAEVVAYMKQTLKTGMQLVEATVCNSRYQNSLPLWET